jgi:flagellum-specific ATP synthase
MDPVVDAVRSLLDGHVVLDRGLTSSGHYPPIDILESLSRLMPAICSEGQIANALRIRELMASYKRSEDLIRIGAYQGGADPSLDNAVRLLPRIQNYLRQASTEKTNLQDAVAGLASLLS